MMEEILCIKSEVAIISLISMIPIFSATTVTFAA